MTIGHRRIVAQLSATTYDRLRALSLARSVSMAELIRRAVARLLDEAEKEGKEDEG